MFTSSPVSGTASASANVGPLTVQQQDQFGNPTTTAQTIKLTSSPAGAVFATGQNGAGITSVTMPAGSSSAIFYFGDATAGTPTITAQATGLAVATQQETVSGATASKLVFTTSPVSGSASASANLGPLTVQEQDQSGHPVSAAQNLSVALSSSSSGAVFATSPNGSPVASVTIPAGSSSATFYYGETKAGTPTVTAHATGLSAAAQIEAVSAAVASNLIFTSSPASGTASSSANLGPLTVEEQDQFGNRPRPRGPST